MLLWCLPPPVAPRRETRCRDGLLPRESPSVSSGGQADLRARRDRSAAAGARAAQGPLPPLPRGGRLQAAQAEADGQRRSEGLEDAEEARKAGAAVRLPLAGPGRVDVGHPALACSGRTGRGRADAAHRRPSRGALRLVSARRVRPAGVSPRVLASSTRLRQEPAACGGRVGGAVRPLSMRRVRRKGPPGRGPAPVVAYPVRGSEQRPERRTSTKPRISWRPRATWPATCSTSG